MKKTFKECLKQLRKLAIDMSDDTLCPKEYAKYNRKDKPLSSDNPGGRAWFMFMLDEFEKKNL